MNTIPTAHKKEFISESPYKGKFIIEPLYPGYGLTLGNALRRVLLSSLEGVAISSIRVKGADHEFTAIEGVKEDLIDIILNLKQVRFDVTGEFEEPIKIELNAKGVKEIKAGNFKKTAGVKIANPDLVIANLTDAKTNFELEAWIEKGRGYLPTEMVEGKEREIGVIAIDAIFTPIKRVAIDTENVRVEDMTNWDRLILNLETDGTISCEDALNNATIILVKQLQFLLDSKISSEKEVVEADVEDEKTKKRSRPKKE